MSTIVNNIGNDGAKHMAEALKSNTALKEINLRCFVLPFLSNHNLLQTIINNIGNEGAQMFRKVFKINKTLKDIDLGLNEIDKTELAKLTIALKLNEDGDSLYLSRSYIGDPEAKIIAGALRKEL